MKYLTISNDCDEKSLYEILSEKLEVEKNQINLILNTSSKERIIYSIETDNRENNINSIEVFLKNYIEEKTNLYISEDLILRHYIKIGDINAGDKVRQFTASKEVFQY